MNLKQVVDSVFGKASQRVLASGKKLFNSGLVLKVSSKKIDNIYHIYGRVKSENNKECNTHIKINLTKGVLEETQCECNNFMDSVVYNKAFICEHIVGTTYVFYDTVQKSMGAKANIKKEKCPMEQGDILVNSLIDSRAVKEKINIDVKLNHVQNNSLGYFQAEFKIGSKSLYPINSLECFIEARRKGNSLYIGSDFTYHPKIHYFSSYDEQIISFIEEYILISKESLGGAMSSSFQIVKGRKLSILPNALRRFLEPLNNKRVGFKYEYLDYTPKISNKDIPISFTLKDEENSFVLTTKRKLPTQLTENGDVYFYDREIYLPSKNQREIYGDFYRVFRNEGRILFSKNKGHFNQLITLLNSISKDITLDEGIKRFVAKIMKPKFYINKIGKEVSCEVKVNYGVEEFDLITDLENNNIAFRDYKMEERIEMLLERFRFIKKQDKFLFIGDEEDIYKLLITGISELRKAGEVIISDEFQKNKVYNGDFIKIYIDEGNQGLFKISYNIGDMDNREFRELFTAFKDHRSFYRTKDNSFIDLEDDGVKTFLNLIDGLQINENKLGEEVEINKNKAYYVKKSGVNLLKGSELLKSICDKITEVEGLDYDVPTGLKANLREYQIIGYKWLKTVSYMGFGGILADEMGLGKTIQTIGFLLSEQGAKSLIVTPTSLIYNWKDEFEKFAPDLRVGIVHGNKEQRGTVIKSREDYDVILTTYGTLRMDFEIYKGIKFDFCIIDEGQNIKNHLSQTTERLKDINAKCRFALTGTPIENNLMELWSIFDFIMPDYLYTKEKFQYRFVNGRQDNIEELKTLIRPFILRRLKQDVLKELPDKIEKKFLVEMTVGQSRAYKSYMRSVKEKLKNNKEDRITIFSYLTKLRQLCLDPSLLIEDYLGGSGKFKVAMELIEESINQGKKILLFSQFTAVLKNISKVLDDNGVEYLYLDGSTKAIDRVKMVDEFNKSSTIKIFLISLKAGGTGLNLTSANVVIHFDPWWNPAIEDQATDRAHRIGQKNSVQVIKLVAKGTIEEKIINLQEDKKELINNVINGELQNGSLLSTLNQQEILDLFQ